MKSIKPVNTPSVISPEVSMVSGMVPLPSIILFDRVKSI